MTAPLDLIKKLREATSMGISDCRRALEESKGDFVKALEVLKRRSLEISAKKADRPANYGSIRSYIHFDSRMGALVEVDSETDFVARNEEFIKFTADMALQVAATNPKYIKREDVPKEEIKGLQDTESFYKEACLLEQPFIKNPSLLIKDYLNSLAAKFGENILIRRFCRFQLGK